MITDQAIVRHLERLPHRSAGFKQLVREMSVRGNDRRVLAERLEALVKTGRLIETGRDRFTLAEHAASHQNLIAGRLNMHRDGYGFVIPNAGQRTTIEGDIYINPQAIGSAMHGDQVLVELGRRKDDGRSEGKILRVLTRAHPTVVGKFHYGSRHNYVTPIDEKMTREIVIPRGAERPAGSDQATKDKLPTGESRDRVLGKEVHRRQSNDLEGVVVDVEITSWPSPAESPRGRVLEILGDEDDFGVDVEIVIRKHHLPHQFPVEVLQEAEQFSRTIAAKELAHRRDYRALPIVTIDGETARDFDDAVTVRRLANDNYELQVHIADVAHYVSEGTPIDLEARLRGTSVYFPDRAVPMLPMELSTDLCSLRPHVERLVLSCVMEIDHHGEVVGFTLNEGVIRSAERMTYTNVNLVLEGDKGLREHYHPYVDLFELMRELAMVLNRKRVRRGSIDFDLPEPVIEFDENGLMKGVTRSERNIANRLIEEFMLAANECVASYLEKKQVGSLYRIHEKPDPKRVYDFETIAAAFGYSLGVGPLPVKRVQMKSERRERYGTGQRAKTLEIPGEVHITPRMYQKLTQKIAGKPEERIVSYLMLRSLKQAKYSAENEGHFALAAPAYTHFTSPIRRYPDLIVHRILKEVLRDSPEQVDDGVPVGIAAGDHSESPSPWSKREPAASASRNPKGHGEDQHRAPLGGPIPQTMLQEIADESSVSERRADEAERELMEWKKTKFMEQHIGAQFDGMIVSVTKFGMFVELNELFIEGLVPLATLADDRYLYHENTRQIIGQRTRKTYSIGNPIRIFVDRIDHMQKRLQFGVVDEAPPPRKKKKKT
ncbi:MAG TPA: VacB/RNase II family 3'-5' exoribonuclease [Candidatus Angelobacter sp.]|nr:VacB/RNase II family 3'-5' exoribonuclease [Candidatus Angelobacter sp.]